MTDAEQDWVARFTAALDRWDGYAAFSAAGGGPRCRIPKGLTTDELAGWWLGGWSGDDEDPRLDPDLELRVSPEVTVAMLRDVARGDDR